MVRLLINNGPELEATDKDQWTPLMWTAMNGFDNVARILIDEGAQVDAADKDQQTSLMVASLEGHASLAQLLIDNGARVDTADKNLLTPLILAARCGHDQVVQVLIKSGAIVNAADNSQLTALMIAAQIGHKSVVQILIQHGAFTDATNDKGQTALMLAASEGHADVVKALLSANASTTTSDANHETALMYAIDSNHQDIIHDILSVENDVSQTMVLLKLGLQKRRHDVAAKKMANDDAKAEVKIPDLFELCSKMHEAETISDRICSRLLYVEKQLSTLNELVKQDATERLKLLVNKTQGFMLKYADKTTVTRLVGSQVFIKMSRDINRELDAFLLHYNLRSDEIGSSNWEIQ